MLAFVLCLWATGQTITNYTFTPSAGTFTAITGGTSPTFTGTTPADDGYANSLPLGFSFTYMGIPYTTFAASTNGFIVLGGTLTASGPANGLTSTTPRPIIAPLWDDLAIGAVTDFTYQTNGTAGSRVFTAQWLNAKWNYNGTSAALSFQLNLYEATGKVEFVYHQLGGALNSASASIGISAIATGSGNFLSLNGAGVSPTASSTTETITIATKPAEGQTYSFTPPSGGAPADPINLTFTSVGLTALTLNWDDNSSNENFFVITRALDAGFTTSVVISTVASTTTAGTGTAYNSAISGLAAGTTYYFKVAAAYEGASSAGITGNQTTTAPVPMTGIWTIDPAGSGGSNFTTFAAAITALNANGIGSGGVTFNVADGATFSETGQTITVTGTASNPIVFQQSGSGTRPIVNFTGTSGSSDFAFKLAASDYITFKGLDIRDAGTTSSNYVEYGFYLLGTATDGCQYNTIQYCSVDLTKANTSSRGVYQVSAATAATGANTYNKYYNNTVQDAYYGYYFGGASAALDDNNEIGTISGGTSTITNLGGLSSGTYGVYVNYQTNFKVHHTAINYISGSSVVYGIYEGSGSITSNYYNNEINNIAATSSSAAAGLYITTGTTHEIYNNLIHDISGTSYNAYGLYIVSGTNSIYNNSVYNVSTTSASYAPYGVYLSGTANNFYSNLVYGISSTLNHVYGVYVSSGNNTFNKNTIYNINYSGSGSYIAYGLSVAGGTTNNIFNNFIYDVRAAASTATPGVRGVNLSGGTADNFFYNTILINYVATSTANQSAAIYLTTGPTSANLRNNIVVNNTTPGSGATSKAVALWRTSATLTTFSTNSNNNLYYAGTPGTKNLIYADGTNNDQTLSAYKARVSPRDNNAVTENPPFISTSGTYNLHLNNTPATLCESGGIQITTPLAITSDFDGDIRWGETGYAGAGTATDIGADEGDFTGFTFLPPANFGATPYSSTQINLTFTPTGTPVNNVVIVWNTTGTFTTPTGALPAIGSSFAGGTLLSNGTTSPVAHTGLTFGTTYYYIAYSYDGASAYTTGITASATPTVAPPTSLTATPISISQINLGWALNTAGHNVVIATNSTATFGTPVNGTALNVSDPITGGGTVIYTGPLAAFNHTSLTSGTLYYYKAWSIDGASYYSGTGATANATTICDAISAYPWNESFESVTIPAFPACWFKENGDWATTNNANSSNDADAHTGTQFLRESWSATNEYIWTPGFAVTAGTSYDFSFWWAGDNLAGWTGDVFYNTTQISTGATQLGTSFVINATTTTKTYAQVTNVFIAPATGTYYFAIRVNCPTSSPWYLSFDDFKMQPTPTCLEPATITATSVTVNSATINWTASASAPADGYDIYYSTSSTSPTISTTPSGSVGAGVITWPTGSVLSANTTYYVWVRSNCGSGGYSSWTGPQNFKTLCSVSSAFAQNFDAITTPALPDCWYKVGTGGSAYTQTSNSNSSPNCLFVYSSSSSSTAVISMPPVDNAGAGTYRLRFKIRGNSSSGETIQVGYLTNPTDAATFVSVQSVTASTLTYQEKIVDLGTAPGTAQVLAFKNTGTMMYSVLIDDVVWEETPVCTGAVGGTATAVTAAFCGASGSTTINATGFSPAASTLTYQWESSIDNSTFAPISLQVNPASMATGTISQTTYYRLAVTCGAVTETAYSDTVTVTVNPIPVVTVTPNSGEYCGTGSIALSASGADAYSWSPATGLNLTNVADVIASPAVTTTYTVSGSTNGCSGNANVTITVNPVPGAIVITPASASINAGDVQELTASGGVIAGFPVFSENFNSPTNSWTSENTSTLGTPANAAWTLQSDGYVYGSPPVTFHSNDNSQFYITNSDSQGSAGITNTALISPVINTTGYTALSLKFWHYFRYIDAESMAKVEVSTDGGSTWEATALASYSTTQGSATAFTETIIDLSGYINQSNLKIRFRYHDTYGWYWAIDNVTITGSASAPATWAPMGSLYTDAAGTISYTGTPAVTVYAKPSVTTTYTASVTTNLGCSTSKDVEVTVLSANKTLNLTVFVEGLYTAGGMMNQAFDEMGAHFVAPVADQIVVELHDATTYATIDYSTGLINLNQDGSATADIPAVYSGSYYVTVKHRNSLETTSAAVVDFSGTSIAYDFSTAASQAFGDNLKDVGEGKFAIFGGDANADGSVDALDLIAVDNDASAFASGFLLTDVNGDGAVDALDLILTDNNSSMFVAAILP